MMALSTMNAHSKQNFTTTHKKKLLRLPHIFSRVLELPFTSDANVSVKETEDSIKFIAESDGISNEVKADIVEVFPGVMKILVKGSVVFDEFEQDVWRFRLPQSARAELASAVFKDGELLVIVPKE